MNEMVFLPLKINLYYISKTIVNFKQFYKKEKKTVDLLKQVSIIKAQDHILFCK